MHGFRDFSGRKSEPRAAIFGGTGKQTFLADNSVTRGFFVYCSDKFFLLQIFFEYLNKIMAPRILLLENSNVILRPADTLHPRNPKFTLKMIFRFFFIYKYHFYRETMKVLLETKQKDL